MAIPQSYIDAIVEGELRKIGENATNGNIHERGHPVYISLLKMASVSKGGYMAWHDAAAICWAAYHYSGGKASRKKFWYQCKRAYKYAKPIDETPRAGRLDI